MAEARPTRRGWLMLCAAAALILLGLCLYAAAIAMNASKAARIAAASSNLPAIDVIMGNLVSRHRLGQHVERRCGAGQ
ncbi:hypothetical protein D3C85_725930 [compost metagenome]